MTAGRRALIVVAVFVAVAFGLPGVGAVREAAAQIAVTAADPSAADQGTISLPVTIKGNGFKKGAKTKFYVAGTSDPGGITVSSTRFISSTQLTATIDVAATAVVARFDIEVTNTDGRTGKGTELFKVLEKIDACTMPDPEPAPGSCYSGVPGLPGCLDTTFGNTTGRAIGPRHMSTHGHAVDSVGRVVVVGGWRDACTKNSPTEWAVARYLPNGLPDASFGGSGNGLVRIAFAPSNQSEARALLLQPDGKIVAVGAANPVRRSYGEPVAVRLNADGALDGTFGAGGIAWIPFPAGNAWGALDAVTRQSDGRLVVTGRLSTDRTGFLARLNVNGSLDTSFIGSDGRYIDAGPYTYLSAVRIQATPAGERIVVAGYTGESVDLHHIATVRRFTLSGAPDSSFGERTNAADPVSARSGLVRVFFHDPASAGEFRDEFYDFAIDSANRIVAGGTAWDENEHRLVLARLDSSGDLDPAFGAGGMTALPAGFENTNVNAVALLPDGRILLAGSCSNYPEGSDSPTDIAMGLWRFQPDGAADMTFGVEGRVLTPIAVGARGFSNFGLGLSVLPGGTVVSTGTLVMNGTPRLAFGVIARFWQ